MWFLSPLVSFCGHSRISNWWDCATRRIRFYVSDLFQKWLEKRKKDFPGKAPPSRGRSVLKKKKRIDETALCIVCKIPRHTKFRFEPREVSWWSSNSRMSATITPKIVKHSCETQSGYLCANTVSTLRTSAISDGMSWTIHEILYSVSLERLLLLMNMFNTVFCTENIAHV